MLLPVKMRTGVTIEDITNSKRIELVDVSKPVRPQPLNEPLDWCSIGK